MHQLHLISTSLQAPSWDSFFTYSLAKRLGEIILPEKEFLAPGPERKVSVTKFPGSRAIAEALQLEGNRNGLDALFMVYAGLYGELGAAQHWAVSITD